MHHLLHSHHKINEWGGCANAISCADKLRILGESFIYHVNDFCNLPESSKFATFQKEIG